MKKIAGIFLVLLAVQAQAQQLSSSPELTVLTKSDLMVQSVLNSASSVQVSEITSFQHGNANQLRLNPQMGENQIQLVQQGSFNNMDLHLTGEQNNYQFSQLGNRNDLQINNLQANDNTLQITQRGDGNQLIDNGSGLLSRPMRIEQSGGMKVLINGQ